MDLFVPGPQPRPQPRQARLAQGLRNSGGAQGRIGVLCIAGRPGCISLVGMPAALQQAMQFSLELSKILENNGLQQEFFNSHPPDCAAKQ